MPQRFPRFLAACLAAVLPWLPAAAGAQAPSPRLLIQQPAERPVELRGVAIRAEVSGRLAETSVELTFFNPNARVLEGELQFPLLDGQQVVGMAMDVDGRLREAVPVDKAQGRAVFEDVTRARIDPALLSLTQGSNYKLRVYPILPQREKVVVLRYQEALGTSGTSRGAATYRLPLHYASDLARLAISVRVAGADRAPAVRGAMAAAGFARDGDAYVLDLAPRAVRARGTLEIDVPAARGPRAWTQAVAGATYFHAEVPIAARTAPRSLPRSITLAWDSSGSGRARDHAREVALLDAYFAKAGDVDVRLVRIRDAAEPPLAFRVSRGDWRSLRREIESTIYDGATDLGAIAAVPGTQEILLVSDGLSNFGARSLPVPAVPLYAISSAARADATALRHAAEASGGRYVEVGAGREAEAAGTLLHESTHIVSLDATGATDLVAASPYPSSGRWAVAGMLTASRASVRVVVAHPGGQRQVVDVPVEAGRYASTQAASMWARYRLASLEADYEVNRARIRKLGREFGLVTRETSLIVLDRVEDYARHEIAPPAELLAAYDRLRAQASRRVEDDRKAHLESVVRMLEDKKRWWARDFPKGSRPAAIAAKTEAQPQESAAALGFLARKQSMPVPAAAPTAPSSAPRPAAPAMLQAGARADVRDAVAKDDAGTAVAAIRLRKWTPDAPYASRLRAAPAEDLYRVYAGERATYADSTAFFLDAADVFFERGQHDLGVRVLSNLAEMDLDNRQVLRILGARLVQAKRPALAIGVLRKVGELAPDEPQSFRDLGLAYAANGEYQAAVDALREVVVRPWHGRFPEIELITLAELNAIVATCGTKIDVSRIDPRLLVNLPLDLRVVLTWDADNTDIDLWVTDPNGERAYYGNRLTYQGGRMSLDFTGGYGPEEFSLKVAKPGKYKVEAQFFGNRQQIVAGATTLSLRLTTGFGTAKQKDESVTLRLRDRGEIVAVGEFEVAPD